MPDNPPADDHSAVDSESFEDWLEQAADSKGVSKQELMNQMLSSYWILDELTGLVGETEARGEIGHRSPGPTEPAPEAEGKEGPQEDPSPEESNDTPVESTSTEESIRDIQTAIRELVKSQQPMDASAFGSSSLDGGVVSVVSDLQRQVGKFESKLDDLEDRQNTQFDRVSNELQLLLDRVSELELARDRFVEEGDLDVIAKDLDELDGRFGELRTANDELESRIDREFDSIEDLFRRLLNALDDLDSDLDAATESYRSELEPLKRRQAERKQLEELKTDALNRDIRRGNCESCDRGIDVALLESPECPDCAARFTGIGESGWNPFRSPKLETGTDPIDRR